MNPTLGKNFENRLLQLSAIGILLCLYLLYDSRWISYLTSNTDSGPSIGAVVQIKQDVRFKSNGGFAWNNLFSKRSISIGDSLYVGDASSAKVNLEDGTELELSPGSLVTFRNLDGKASLNLEFGNVKVLKEGTQKIAIAAPEKAGPPRAPAQTLALNWPDDTSILHRHNKLNKPIDVRWRSSGAFGRYKWQIARDQDFNDIVQEGISSRTQVKVSNYPSQGDFFIRVSGADREGHWAAKTAARSLKIEELKKVEITQPQNNAEVVLEINADGLIAAPQEMNLSWLNPDHKDQQTLYEIELHDIRSKAKTTIQESSVLSKVLSLASPGEFAIRVRAKDSNMEWSDKVRFKVSRAKPRDFEAPKISGEIVNGVYTARPASFKWAPPIDASKHVITVKDSNGKIVFKTESTEPTFQRDLPPGEYSAQVYSLTALKKKSPPLSVKFVSNFKSPDLEAVKDAVNLVPDEITSPPAFSIPISWKPAPEANRFAIEVSKERSFQKPTVIPVENSMISEIKVTEPGRYFTRVVTVDSNNRKISSYSNVESFNYNIRRALKTPQLLSPENDYTYFFQNSSDKELLLSWTPVPDANNYEIQMSLDSDFKTLSGAFNSQKPLLKVTDQTPTGPQFWRVRATGDLDQSSNWSKPNEITIESGRMPASR